MNIYLITPSWTGKRYNQITVATSLQYLAALTPKIHSLRADDESFGDKIDFDYDAGLVALSCITPQAPRGYEIADEFRRRGKKVVMGGMHASLMPDEALEHCDSVAVGEAELIWGDIIKDAEKGELKPVYKADRLADFSEIPWPDRSVLKGKRQFPIFNVQTTRGCPFNCSFCSVTRFFGRSYRQRPVEDVIAEIAMLKKTKQLKWNFVFFADDNIVANPAYAKKLFTALIPLKISWEGQASITVADDDELLDLARQSGCLSLAIGMESLSEESLKVANKQMNSKERFERAIKKIHSYKIAVYGLFIFGFDTDDEYCFEDTRQFIEDNKIEFMLLSCLTPLPGTPFYEQYESEGRIVDHDWSKFDMYTVVYDPKKMTREQLFYGRNYVYGKLLSWPSIFRRIFGARTVRYYSLINNIYLRPAIRRLPKSSYVPPKRPKALAGASAQAKGQDAGARI